jgi:hypothetical protein
LKTTNRQCAFIPQPSTLNFQLVNTGRATLMLDQLRNANTGAGQDFTGLTAVVQLRLRVAFGLQTLTVKSRLLTGENTVRIRGNPPAFARVQRERGCRTEASCVGGLNRPCPRASARQAIFTPMWLSSDSSSFVNCRALPHESASLSIGPTF